MGIAFLPHEYRWVRGPLQREFHLAAPPGSVPVLAWRSVPLSNAPAVLIVACRDTHGVVLCAFEPFHD
ncbi:MAG: hypothetical protein Q7V62_01840 [Actinomycetota bacterium]|nr:hypothetical protein [Actinomycetota bacterium]